MATAKTAQPTTAALPMTTPADSLAFDWLIAVLGLWILSGLYFDGWAHATYGQALANEGFVTIYHIALYSGLGASILALFGLWGWNIRKGYAWRSALPAGYMLSLLGSVLFAMGGGVDAAWHTFIGLEVDFEALVSPPHLFTAVAAVLMISGPLRAAWHRPDSGRAGSWRELGPAILSLIALLSFFTFFNQTMNAFRHSSVYASNKLDATYVCGATGDENCFWVWDVLAISYVVVPAFIMTGFILFAIRRWTLPTGALTVIITANVSLMYWVGFVYSGENWIVVATAIITGIVLDSLYSYMKPSLSRVRELRYFAFAAPFLLFLFFFIALKFSTGVYWQVHAWFGAPFIAGVIGLSLSFLMAPPPIPE